MLGKGEPRISYVVGVILSFPGASYLVGLDRIHKLNPGTVETVLLVAGVCLVQQMFLELPLLGYVFAPESTADRVTRSKALIARSGRSAAVIGAGVIGVLLIARGLITFEPHPEACRRILSDEWSRDRDASPATTVASSGRDDDLARSARRVLGECWS